MLVDLPRQWRVVLGGALLVVVVLLFVFVMVGRERSGPAAVVAAPFVLPLPAALTSLDMAPVRQAPAVSAQASNETGDVQMCGGHWLRTNADGSPIEYPDLRSPQFPQARKRLADLLRADQREVAQAAAIWVAMIDADRRRAAAAKALAPASDAADAAAACAAPLCPIAGAQDSEVDALLDQLARLALSARDPAVYAIAFNTCHQRSTGACALLSAEQWTRVDPGNGMPWMHVLAEARERRAAQAEAEALYQVSVAKRFDTREFAIPGLIAAVGSVAPEDEAGTVAVFELAIETFGMAAAWTMPSYQHVTQACRADTLRDANRRQTCEGIATTLGERSDTVLPAMLGLSIGRRLDWPVERVARQRGVYEAYATSSTQETDTAEQALSCGAMRRTLARLERQGEIGEVAYMRQWAKSSGKPPEEFERIGRASIARREAEAASAARPQI